MSNKISYKTPQCKAPTFASLASGDMFRYTDGNIENVYMKAIPESGYAANAILLRTGALYSISPSASVSPVTVPVTITPDAC